MSEQTQNYILIGGAIFAGILGYTIYKDIKKGTEETIGKIAVSATDLGTSVLDIPTNLSTSASRVLSDIGIGDRFDTKALGEHCNNNSDCSISGIEGDQNARLSDKIGCCNNTCSEKIKDFNNTYWCKDDPLLSKGLGEDCVSDNQCSKTGIKGGAPSLFADEIGCCENKCTKKKIDWLGLHWCPNDPLSPKIYL